MSKSVLVLETPESCLDCQFCYELDEGVEACCSIMDDDKDKSLMKEIDCEDANGNGAMFLSTLKRERLRMKKSVTWTKCFRVLTGAGCLINMLLFVFTMMLHGKQSTSSTKCTRTRNQMNGQQGKSNAGDMMITK